MAETLVKNEVCGACGSDVRPDSLFCYHCGGALESEVPDEINIDEPSDVWFRSEIVPVKEDVKEEKVKQEAFEEDAEKVEQEAFEEDAEKVEQEAFEEDAEKVKQEAVEEDADAKGDIEENLEKDRDKKVDNEEKLEEETSVNKVKPKPFEEKLKPKSSRGRYSRKRSKKSVDTKLKSAAALRKREKPSRLKKVEIVWEERDDSPNIWFMVFALLISLVAAGLILLAFYLK